MRSQFWTIALMMFLMIWGRVFAESSLFSSPFNNKYGPNNPILDVKIAPNGQLYVRGGFSKWGFSQKAGFARLNSDGSLDETFNFNVPGVYPANISVIQPLLNGQVLIAGAFGIAGSNGRKINLLLLNSNGTVNPTFSVQTDGSGITSMLMEDNAIVIAGRFDFISTPQTPAVNRKSVARIFLTGQVDPLFLTSFAQSWRINSIGRQLDGKYVAGGENFGSPPATGGSVRRLNSNGMLDLTFQGVDFNLTVRKLAVGINQIMTIGDFTYGYDEINGTVFQKGVMAITTGTDGMTMAGVIAPSFSQSGIDSQILKVQHLGNDTWAFFGPFSTFACYATYYCGGVIKMDSYASLLSDFSIRHFVQTEWNPYTRPGLVYGGEVDPATGKTIVVGNFVGVGHYDPILTYKPIIEGAGHNILRLNEDGTLDHSFKTYRGSDNSVMSITQDTYGKLWVTGDFTVIGGEAANRIAPFNKTTGNLHTGIRPGVGGVPAHAPIIHTMAVDPQGRIIVGGQFLEAGGEEKMHFARFNVDGSLDSAFPSTSMGFWIYDYEAAVKKIVLLSNGSMLVGGSFTSYDIAGGYLMKVNASGEPDFSFVANGAPNGPVHDILLQPDGKILVVGEFNYFGSVEVQKIVRLLPDGQIDPSFLLSPDINGDIYTLWKDLHSSQILVGGKFTQYQGANAAGIVRLNSNGTRDFSFVNPVLPLYTGYLPVSIYAITQDSSGYFIGGAFGASGLTTARGLVRLLNNGTVDNQFSAGRVEGIVRALFFDNSSSSLFVGGKYNGAGSSSIMNFMQLKLPRTKLDTASSSDDSL